MFRHACGLPVWAYLVFFLSIGISVSEAATVTWNPAAGGAL